MPQNGYVGLKAGVALAGAACLVTAVAAGSRARAEQTRLPTAAERAAAASAAVAGRWRTWRAGRIFPAALGYVTNLQTQEKAQRLGISPADGCAGALAGALAAVAERDGRPALATGERRPSIFSPASQLAGELLAPLSRPVTVNCTSREWAC